jgi:hypothetical protein
MDAFEFRLEHIPYEWRGPLVEVLDTAETVAIKLRAIELEPDPLLVCKLTELVLQRKDKEDQKQ